MHMSYCPYCYPDENLGCPGFNEIELGATASVLDEGLTALLREPHNDAYPVAPDDVIVLTYDVIHEYRQKLWDAVRAYEKTLPTIDISIPED